jgi:hypothetical protein
MPRIVKRSAIQAVKSGPSHRGAPLPQFVPPSFHRRSRNRRLDLNKNALKHGIFTAEAIETRRIVAALTKQARELVETIGPTDP